MGRNTQEQHEGKQSETQKRSWGALSSSLIILEAFPEYLDGVSRRAPSRCHIHRIATRPVDPRKMATGYIQLLSPNTMGSVPAEIVVPNCTLSPARSGQMRMGMRM